MTEQRPCLVGVLSGAHGGDHVGPGDGLEALCQRPQRLRRHHGAAHAPEEHGLDRVLRVLRFDGRGGRSESEEEHGVLGVDVEALHAHLEQPPVALQVCGVARFCPSPSHYRWFAAI